MTEPLLFRRREALQTEDRRLRFHYNQRLDYSTCDRQGERLPAVYAFGPEQTHTSSKGQGDPNDHD